MDNVARPKTPIIILIAKIGFLYPLVSTIVPKIGPIIATIAVVKEAA